MIWHCHKTMSSIENYPDLFFRQAKQVSYMDEPILYAKAISRKENTLQRNQIWWTMLLLLGQLWNRRAIVPMPKTRSEIFQIVTRLGKGMDAVLYDILRNRLGNIHADINNQNTTRTILSIVKNTGIYKRIRMKSVGTI